jgi:endonuclease-3
MPRESKKAKRTRARRIQRTLKRLYPARTALHHGNPFELLVATILSAQCTDVRVNQVLPGLFARFRTPADFANANPEAVEDIIRSTGFFRAKTRHIIAVSRELLKKHNGQVPQSLDELIRLDGVGRKTANVVMGSAFGIASGVVVDTHVGRLSRRMQLTRHQDPAKVELDLMDLLPKSVWIEFSHQMIWHGRALCLARSPHCEECPLVLDCPGSRDFLPVKSRPKAASARSRQSRKRLGAGKTKS